MYQPHTGLYLLARPSDSLPATIPFSILPPASINALQQTMHSCISLADIGVLIEFKLNQFEPDKLIGVYPIDTILYQNNPVCFEN